MVCALVAATAGASTATPSLTGVPLPGLTSDEGSNVDAESCSVTLSGRDVTMELSVRVDSDQAALLIEGSRFGWRGESAAYPDRHFPELEIQIDGALVKPEDRFEAFMGKTDITGAIRDAGMDPWAVAHDPPATPVRPDSRALKVLERMHAVQRSGDEYLANWTARRVLRIPLKDSKHQRIELHYRARPAATQVQSDQLFTSEREAAYCLSAKANAMLHPKSGPQPVHLAEYAIAAGIDGRTPPTVLLATSGQTGTPAGASRVLTFACGPHGQPIAAKGNLTPRPVQVDQAGNLHILEVTDP